jgi:phenylalanyl-tRNA synthetase beta chain
MCRAPGLTLKAGKIRGEESNGMLCSARELGLGHDHDGIIDLPKMRRWGKASSTIAA